MAPLLESARAIVKNVTDIFGKTDGERSKCPRCKGSGLLMGPSVSTSKGHSITSNAACWFCEGMGVMSVAGVNGYMLGRSTAVVNTKLYEMHPGMPVNMQLYNGKYPGSKCKLLSYKPVDGAPQMLLDPLSNPHFLHDFPGDATSSDLNFSEAMKILSDPTEPEEFASWTFMSPEHLGKRYQHKFHARLSAPFSSPKPATVSRLPQFHRTTSDFDGRSSTLALHSSAMEKKDARDCTACDTFQGFLVEHSGDRNAGLSIEGGKTATDNLGSDFPVRDDLIRGPSRGSRHGARNARPVEIRVTATSNNGDGNSRTLQAGTDSEAGKFLSRGSGKQRSFRKPRNRVREEAEKEAELRAQRAGKVLMSRPLQAPSITSDPLVDCLLNDQSAEDEYQDLMGLQQKTMRSRIVWPFFSASNKGISPDLSFINKLLYKKAKDVISCNPSTKKR